MLRLPAYWLIAVVLAAASCATPRSTPTRPALPTLDAPAILQLLEARYPTVPIAGSATLRVQSRQGKQTVTVGYLFAPPDRLRVDVSTLFGIPLASLAVSADSFAYFEHGSNRYLAGPLSEMPALAGVPLPLNPRVFATLLAGVPTLEGWPPDRAEAVRTPQGYALTMRRSGLAMGIGFDHDLLVKRIVYEPAGITLEFRDYRPVAEGVWPHETRVEAPRQGLSVEIEWGTRTLHPETAGNPFVLSPPPQSGPTPEQR